MRRPPAAATARLAVWTALLLVLGRTTLALGSGPLGVPLTSPHALRAWVDDTDPADMAAALVRLGALAAIAYLLAATALVVASGLVGRPGLTAVVERITPAVVRRLATGTGGLGLALGSVVGVIPGPELTGAPPGQAALVAPGLPSATMTRVDADRTAGPAPGTVTMTRLDDAPPDTATMTRAGPLPAHTLPGPAPPRGPVAPAPRPPADLARSSPRAAPDAADSASSWTVAPGDSFWSIAEDIVTPPRGPAPTDRRIARYWRRLIDANRARLVDPGNPDLLLPGQRLDLPPPDT